MMADMADIDVENGAVLVESIDGEKGLVSGGLLIEGSPCLIFTGENGESSIKSIESLTSFQRSLYDKGMWDVVKNVRTEEIGMVTENTFNGKVVVNYDGFSNGRESPIGDLVLINPPKKIPNPLRCGLGLGRKCCIFLTAKGSEDPRTCSFVCSRYTADRIDRLHLNLTARRNPAGRNCQLRKF